MSGKITTNELNDSLKSQINTIGTLSNLQTTAKTDLVSAVNELFTNASNGKTQIATAITGKGVAASNTETFSALATKIGQIKGNLATGNTNLISTSETVNANGDILYFCEFSITGLSFTPTLVAFFQNAPDPKGSISGASYGFGGILHKTPTSIYYGNFGGLIQGYTKANAGTFDLWTGSFPVGTNSYSSTSFVDFKTNGFAVKINANSLSNMASANLGSYLPITWFAM